MSGWVGHGVSGGKGVYREHFDKEIKEWHWIYRLCYTETYWPLWNTPFPQGSGAYADPSCPLGSLSGKHSPDFNAMGMTECQACRRRAWGGGMPRGIKRTCEQRDNCPTLTSPKQSKCRHF